MDFLKMLLKGASPALLISLLPLITTKIGNDLKNKDSNDTGRDDAAGNVVLAIGTVLPALVDGNENAVVKGLTALRDFCNAYLASRKPASLVGSNDVGTDGDKGAIPVTITGQMEAGS